MNRGNASVIEHHENIVAVVTLGDAPDGQIRQRMTRSKFARKLDFERRPEMIVRQPIPGLGEQVGHCCPVPVNHFNTPFPAATPVANDACSR